MATEEMTRTHPGEQAGMLVGRAYAAAVTALAGPIRKPATPTWHWRAAHRAGTAVRAAAGSGVDVAERRIRTAPRRLVNGLKRLWRASKGKSWKAFGPRAGTAAFLGWWGWSWAAETRGQHPPTRRAVGRSRGRTRRSLRSRIRARSTAGDTPGEGPPAPGCPRLPGRHPPHAPRRPGLHLADLADQITARSKAHGTPFQCTVANLRALLEPLGVPIRDQLAIDGTNRPGIHAGDWRVWHARHHPTSPASPPPREEAPTPLTREEPLPHAETADETIPLGDANPQVSGGDLEISDRDLGQDDPPGEESPDPYTAEQLRLLEHTRTAIGTARGAHLRDILAVAQAAGDYPDWSVTRLRRGLLELRITVEDKLWLNGGNTRGVLATSLPPLPALEQETP
ncbi:hypothetical protein AB0K74_11360 [Streptomyces sp. NPDC056159]|uniref:hypothetical protein n=1 Tax=Streptomyces sp. NPDC056159 TaxID=3155537 RepID=UPI0034341304